MIYLSTRKIEAFYNKNKSKMTSETNYDVMEKNGEKLKLLETYETQLPIQKLIDLELIEKGYEAYADFCIEVVIRLFEDWGEVPVFVNSRFTYDIDGKKIKKDVRYNTSSPFAMMMCDVWDMIDEEEAERKKEEEEEKKKQEKPKRIVRRKLKIVKTL